MEDIYYQCQNVVSLKDAFATIKSSIDLLIITGFIDKEI